MSACDALERLLRDIDAANRALPPVEQWHPDFSGDIDIRIDHQGRWFHEGTLMTRHQLVVLFSGILRREPAGYMLVTPVEKWRVQVEDHAFVSTGVVRRNEDGLVVWVLQDNVGRQHAICTDTPLLLDEFDGQQIPWLSLPRGLGVRVSRNDYYFLVEQGECLVEQGEPAAETLVIYSAGQPFVLGYPG